LTICFSGQVGALDPSQAITRYLHETWGIEKGLEQKDIYALIQTRDQYLWLATSEGLLRFDGYRFQLFSKADIEGLRQSFISTFLESRDGTLWIGSYGGGLIRFRNGRFSLLTSEEGLANNLVRSLAEGNDGSLWIGSFGGVDRFQQGRFTHYSTAEGLSSNNVKALCLDQDGVLWAGTAQGLCRFRNGRFHSVPILDSRGMDATTFVNEIRQSRDGGIWVGLHGGGLVHMKGQATSVYTIKDGLSSDFILSLTEDREGNLWIGTMGGGINRLANGRFSAFTTVEGLSNDSVYSLLEDRDGSVWAGTTGNGGLNRFRDAKFINITTREGLSDNQICSLAEGKDGTVWIGGQGGLAFSRDGTVARYDLGEFYRKRVVRSIVVGNDGSVWIGTEGFGLSRLKNGKMTTFTTRQGLSHDLVWSLCVDREDGLWIGTDDGLTRMQGEKLTRYSVGDGLPSAVIRSIITARDGSVWIGTNDGLARFQNGSFTYFTTREGMSLNMVRSLFEDREGALWIGTLGGGLNRYQDGRFSVFTTREGLAADEIWSIHEDGSGHLWMSCNRGIFRVAKGQLLEVAAGIRKMVRSDFFGRAEGIKDGCLGGSSPAGCVASDGRIWFPTQSGVFVVDPSRLPVNRSLPALVIEEALIDSRSYPVSTGIVAPPGKGNLEIHYTAMSFLDPEGVIFRYCLEGFDSAWNEVGNRRVAFYTNIPPGEYRFRVSVANRDGKWANTGVLLTIRLRPFFTQTVWFYGLCLLGVIAATLEIFRIRVKRLKTRELELTRLVGVRTEELENTLKQLEEANTELERLTLTDRLADIANRRGLENAFHNEWFRCMREEKPLSLIMVDIDFFKNFNDALGHLSGDECLKQVAAVLKSSARRPGDLAARYGGEEFVVLLPGTDAAGVSVLAEQIRGRVERLGIAHPDSLCSPVLTISLGTATVVPDANTTQDFLLTAADQMLYMAKKAGRNQVAGTEL